jgi:tetratricopeptide (TPR) repeat protein
MKTIDYSYFIERYNTGEMDQIEKIWFEKELNGNDNLQKEVRLRKRVDDLLIHHDLITLRTKLADLEKERKQKAAASAGKKITGMRYAAAIAAMMVLGTIYLMTADMSSPEKLYNRNFNVYDLSINTRAGSSDINSGLSSALQLYNDMNYAAAAALFRDYLINHPSNMEAQLVYGVSEMKNKNYPDAKSAFQTVISHNDNLFIDMARWYLALCCIKTEDYSQAKVHLDAISNSESIYKSKARKLSKRIK